MAIADSNFGRVAYYPEKNGTVWELGYNPATKNATVVRMTSSDFAYSSETTTSNELRIDRMVADAPEVSATSAGTINFELSLGGSFDDFFEAALCGTWTTAVNFTGAVTFAAGTNTITDDAASNAFTNVTVGQWIYITNAVDVVNNGWHRVTAKASANEITVSTTLADEVADTVTIKGRMLRNGTVKRSFGIEQAFLDIEQFFLFHGQRVNTMALNAQAGSIVTGSFGFQGTSVERDNSTFINGTTTPVTTTPVVNATSNVGAVLEGTSLTKLTTALQSIQINLDNGLRNQNAIGSKFPVGIGLGRQTVSGTIDAYFEDGTLYDKFLMHSSTALSFDLTDGTNRIRITLPKVFFSSSAPTPGGIDQDVMQSIQFQAVADPVTACQIQIDIV